MNLPIYQVDAFAEESFSGNPAAIIVLKEWLSDHLMQQIAAENNLAETAFIVRQTHFYEIRWFTPLIEVDLCGHATLASAYVILNYIEKGANRVEFVSPRSGKLVVEQKDGLYEMDFPMDQFSKITDFVSADMLLGIGLEPKYLYKGKTDYLLIYENQDQIKSIDPDFHRLARIDGRGIIVTAPGKDCDFVSRFFAPQSGINEDPVTGSAHTTLIPYWNKITGKTNFTAKQLSKRGGTLFCSLHNDRVKIAGKAKMYLIGQIQVD